MVYWTNKSVRLLGEDLDPIDAISAKARDVIYQFIESGGNGPPFNPFEIAANLRIETRPSEDVRDAKTVFQNGRFVIEFNPNRPTGRINYSVAHDIVHTFFPDCKEEVRNRVLHGQTAGDEWQLEMLCNIGASELLMPIGSFPDLGEEKLSILELLQLQRRFNVSMEALLLRFVKLTKRSCWVFAASRVDPEKSQYKIDYVIPSARALPQIRNGMLLPSTSVVSDCTAIGFTATGEERWSEGVGSLKVECIGVAPYPGHPYPRVVGFAKPVGSPTAKASRLTIVKGDATKPRGSGRKIIAFIVNDATPRWGAGFALAIRRKWPAVQSQFIKWAEQHPEEFLLGRTLVTSLTDEVDIAQMICQRGYGESVRPRIRYGALEQCLSFVGGLATTFEASVHMPAIGSGQARGNWSIISEMIERRISREGVSVTIYELPGQQPIPDQLPLLFSR